MTDSIQQSLEESSRILYSLAEGFVPQIARAAEMILLTFSQGGKLLIIGNGGSAAQASHMAAELVGKFGPSWRKALPAIALTADPSILTALGNDLDFDFIFSRQIEALARPGDALLALSTSGQSANILQGLMTANQRGVHTLALLGGDGGKARWMANQVLIAPSRDTARVQEAHLAIIHAICAEIERGLK